MNELSSSEISAKFAAISLGVVLSGLPFMSDIGLLDTPSVWGPAYYAALTVGAFIAWRRLHKPSLGRHVAGGLTVAFILLTLMTGLALAP